MRILFIGDIFGKPGREIARRAIPALIERESLDFVIANVENSAAGFGVTGEPIGVINVMGRVFMQPLDDPFAVVLKEIEALRAKTRVIIVDFHAEATSEKVAMGWH